jgi:hypothetical protein
VSKPPSDYEVPFGPEDFPFFLDHIYRLVPSSPLWSSLIVGLSVYLLGLLASLAAGFPEVFIDTPLLRHVAFSTFLALAAIGYAKQEIIDSLGAMRPCFAVDDEVFVTYVRKCMLALFSRRGPLVVWAALSVVAVWGTTSALYPYPLIRPILSFLSTLPFNEILGTGWFGETRVVKVLVIDSILLVGAVPLSVGLWGGFKCVALLAELLAMPVIPMPGVLLALLRRPTDLFLKVSFAWFLLTASSGVVLFERLDAISGAILLTIGSVGLVLFFLPQFAFHVLVIRSYHGLAHLAACEYVRLAGSSAESARSIRLLEYCTETSENVKPKDLWVFDVSDVVLLFLGQMVSVAGTLWASVRP